MEKISYAQMLPHEIVSRRQQFPAAFVGLGALEWHGEHQAVGLDVLKADKLCQLAAERSGGFVFPPLSYGEPRVFRLMDFSFDEGGGIKSKMGFNPVKFADSYYGKTGQEQVEFYQALLYHMLIQINTLEMKAVCLCCGHGPLLDFAQPVVDRFNATFSDMRAFAGTESVYAPEERSQEPQAAKEEKYYPAPTKAQGGAEDSDTREIWYRKDVGEDHAGKWETSYLMHLYPECVNMGAYREGEPLTGIMGIDPATQASAEIGGRGCNLIVEGMVRKAKQLLDEVNPSISVPGGPSR